MQIRVRQVVPYLSHDALVKQGVIPVLKPAIGKGEFPSWVKQSKTWPRYGLLLDSIICTIITRICHKRGRLCLSLIDGSVGWKSQLYSHCQQAYRGSRHTPSEEKLYLQLHRYKQLRDWIAGWLSTNTGTIMLGSEWAVTDSVTLQGHPDIVCGSCILDIKATQDYSKMRKETALQLLSYCALARAKGVMCNRVGVMSALSMEVQTVDVEGWDCTAFLSILLEKSRELLEDRVVAAQLLLEMGPPVLEPFCLVGSHVAKSKHLLTSIASFPSHLPVQVCLRSPVSDRAAVVSDIEVLETRQYVETNAVQLFVHGSYLLNAAHPLDKHVRGLRMDLEIAARVGCKGVVIHTGKAKTLAVDKAAQRMKQSLSSWLQYATLDCPLLLETGAGQGTELLCKVEEMALFYNSFNEQERQRLKLCVDFAHIWACGYEPDEYLTKLLLLCGKGSVSLIHFNNSAVAKGARKDRHAPILHGRISVERMMIADRICVAHGIPCVKE